MTTQRFQNFFSTNAPLNNSLLYKSWQGIFSAELVYFLSQLDQLWMAGSIAHSSFPIFQLVGLFGKRFLDLCCDFDSTINEIHNFNKLLFLEPSSRHGGGADADSSRIESACI